MYKTDTSNIIDIQGYNIRHPCIESVAIVCSQGCQEARAQARAQAQAQARAQARAQAQAHADK